MSFDFYLFDVNDGQCAVVKMPNGKWCIFDAGRSAGFSPVVAVWSMLGTGLSSLPVGLRPPFTFLKATISHLHADHLADYANLFTPPPTYFKTVEYDAAYLDDAIASSSHGSVPLIVDFCKRYMGTYGGLPVVPDYGGASIRELGLAVEVARALGGSANSKVNNASIVTRIDCYGHAILISGDMEKDAWDFVLTSPTLGPIWRPFVSNIDVFVAPHHGHSSGYSTELMTTARPNVVLISVASKDPHVDTRYSSEAVSGIKIDGKLCKSITTRSLGGHIIFSVAPPVFPSTKGKRTWRL
jgi:hypothetical protein